MKSIKKPKYIRRIDDGEILVLCKDGKYVFRSSVIQWPNNLHACYPIEALLEGSCRGAFEIANDVKHIPFIDPSVEEKKRLLNEKRLASKKTTLKKGTVIYVSGNTKPMILDASVKCHPEPYKWSAESDPCNKSGIGNG
jgi:hypothetical protein